MILAAATVARAIQILVAAQRRVFVAAQRRVFVVDTDANTAIGQLHLLNVEPEFYGAVSAISEALFGWMSGGS